MTDPSRLLSGSKTFGFTQSGSGTQGSTTTYPVKLVVNSGHTTGVFTSAITWPASTFKDPVPKVTLCRFDTGRTPVTLICFFKTAENEFLWLCIDIG